MIADDSPKRTSALRPSYAPDVLIIRLKHVGLPLAAEAVRGGLTFVGYDVDEAVVDDLNAGRSHTALVSGMAIRCHELGDIPLAGERVLCAPTTRHPRPGTRVRPHGSSRQALTFRREISYQTMHMMTWLIAGGFAVVLGGLMLYRIQGRIAVKRLLL